MYNVLVKGRATDGKEATIEIPVECKVLLIRRKPNSTLRAVATIDYAGVFLGQIEIHENRGNIEVVYPYKMYERKNGGQGRTTVARPNNGTISNQFTKFILNEYSKATLDRGGFTTLTLPSESVPEPETAEEATEEAEK